METIDTAVLKALIAKWESTADPKGIVVNHEVAAAVDKTQRDAVEACARDLEDLIRILSRRTPKL